MIQNDSKGFILQMEQQESGIIDWKGFEAPQVLPSNEGTVTPT